MNVLESRLDEKVNRSTCRLCFGANHTIVEHGNGSHLLRCLDCGAIFVFPLPTCAEVAAHFQESNLDEVSLQRRFEENREDVLARVASYLHRRRDGGCVLDVACATGLFLHRFFRGPRWETWGVDLNPAEVRSAQKKGVRACLGTLREVAFGTASFDIVTVLDAFYYFPEPQQELSEMRRILKPNGLLVIELPLATARVWGASTIVGRWLKGRKKPLLETSDHLYYFTPQSISRLLRQSGFRIDSVVQLPGNQQETLWRQAAFFAYGFLSWILHRLSSGKIALGPRFFVVATKAS